MNKVKQVKLSASLEDYLEAIYNLAEDNDFARSTDIAKQLGVSKASVTGALRTLSEKGYANYEPYGRISLTKEGTATAADVAHKHDILRSFFHDVLGIDNKIAQKAACKSEHALGAEVIGRLLLFIEFVTDNSKNGFDLKEEFKKFCKNNSKSKKKG
ncbi:MAG: metal-dependent transcriptional regulator [Planctomycetota bacterium]|jgi:DtxR family Mn-dependent transcriptional regulator